MIIMKDLSISKRLAIIMCSALVMILITETAGIINNRRLASEIKLGYEAITRPLAAIGSARGKFNAMRTGLHNLAHDFNTSEQNRRFKAEIMQNLNDYERNISQYKEILDTYGTNAPYEQEAVDYLHEMLVPLREYVEYIIPIAERTGFEADAVRLLRGGFLNVAEDISLELMLLTDILEAQSKDANLQADALFQETIILFVIVITASIVILTSSAFIFARSIIKPLHEITNVALDLSNGNLETVDLGFRSKNELGILADSFRHMIHGLKVREMLVSGITYASKIQRSLLPPDSVFKEAFTDYSVIWEPKDIVGGDIYWAKNFGDGTVLCVCDCTGHGTPGALLTMLLVSTIETVVTEQRHADTAQLIYMIDKRLASVLQADRDTKLISMGISDGCDLAVLFIAKDGHITMSAGNTHLYVCDGKEVTRYKGQLIFVGEGKLKSKDEVIVQDIPANPDNKFYIASDGMFDQIGCEQKVPFGYSRFKQIILENHHESQSVISGKLWDAFEKYRGEEQRRDDVELITFKPKIDAR